MKSAASNAMRRTTGPRERRMIERRGASTARECAGALNRSAAAIGSEMQPHPGIARHKWQEQQIRRQERTRHSELPSAASSVHIHDQTMGMIFGVALRGGFPVFTIVVL